MKKPSRFFLTLLVAVMPAFVSACDNTAENSTDFLVSTGAKVGNGAVRGSVEEFTKAIRLDPESAGAYAGRGAIKFAMGDNRGAIADFTKAIELDQKSAGYYSGRGTARLAAGDIPGAIGDFTCAGKVMAGALFSSTEEKSLP